MAIVANPTVKVNGTVVAIQPGSFEYDEGRAETKTRVSSTGGGGIRKRRVDDIETAFSSVKFTIDNDDADMNTVRDWIDNDDANEILASAPGWSRAFSAASVSNKATVSTGVDGSISVEWETDPAT